MRFATCRGTVGPPPDDAFPAVAGDEEMLARIIREHDANPAGMTKYQ